MTLAEQGPDSSPPTPNATDEEGRKQGLWSDDDPHGGVMVGNYVDGVREGEWKHYFADGRLRSQGHFSGGELDGEWTWYRSNGFLMQQGGFSNNVKHGEWQRWNAAGEPIDRGTYDLGRKTGEWTTFHPDGSVKRVTTHRS